MRRRPSPDEFDPPLHDDLDEDSDLEFPDLDADLNLNDEEFDDEEFDALLPDDDYEPFPEPGDFWTD